MKGILQLAATLFVCIAATTIVCHAAESTADAKPAAESKAGPAAEKWKTTFGQWKDVLAGLRELRDKFLLGEEKEHDALRAEYAELLAKGKGLMEQLRIDGAAAYVEAPNEDRELSKFLVKMVGDDIESDRYEKAAELAATLLDNGCDDERLWNWAGIAAFALHNFEEAKEYFTQADEAGKLDETGTKLFREVDDYIEYWEKEQELRKAEAEADDLPRVKMTTSKGELVIELFENEAPETVGNFINLVEKGFYDGVVFHRVLPGFMAQGGCPEGTGRGGPGYTIYCECDRDDARMHFRGSLSMAHAGKNTGGSQFFLTFLPTPWLNKKHTVFGRVIEGMEVLEKIQRRNPDDDGPKPKPDKIVKAEVLRKRPDHKYVPNKVQ